MGPSLAAAELSAFLEPWDGAGPPPCFLSACSVMRILNVSTCPAGAGGRLGKEWNYTEAGEQKGRPFLKCSIFRGFFLVSPWIQVGPWKDWPFLGAHWQRCVFGLSSATRHITLNLSLWKRVSTEGNIKVNNNWAYTNVADFHIFHPFILLLS